MKHKKGTRKQRFLTVTFIDNIITCALSILLWTILPSIESTDISQCLICFFSSLTKYEEISGILMNRWLLNVGNFEICANQNVASSSPCHLCVYLFFRDPKRSISIHENSVTSNGVSCSGMPSMWQTKSG